MTSSRNYTTYLPGGVKHPPGVYGALGLLQYLSISIKFVLPIQAPFLLTTL